MDNNNSTDDLSVDAYMDDEGRITVGEELFIEICEAWIERRGPGIMRKVLADNTSKEVSKKSTYNRQNAVVGTGKQ